MKTLDTNSVAAGLDGSSSHKPTPHNISPLIPERLFEYYYAPLVKNGRYNVLEGEEGEEEVSSASSSDEEPQESASSRMVSEGEGEEGGHEAETTAGGATRQCAGISSQDEAEIAVELARLLKTADENGAETRKVGLRKLMRNGNTAKCIECGKTGRRDRQLSHVLYTHFKLKTWVCPLCQKAYATRDCLTQHLKAIKVDCLCETPITKNNWYEHSKACKACLEVAGGLKIKKGRVAAVQRTVARTRPSARGLSPNEYSPRVLRRRSAAGRNASKKRKFLEFGGFSEDETNEERKPKRVKRDRK